jgi:hypothetical protein
MKKPEPNAEDHFSFSIFHCPFSIVHFPLEIDSIPN